jgi:hypothetical protein
MTITYSFKITAINRLLIYVDEDGNSFENVITKIHYYYYGVDDEGLDAFYNSCLSLGKPNIDTYKEFIELNEEELLSWIETSITDAELSLMQSVIAKNIEEQKTKTTLPWLA